MYLLPVVGANLIPIVTLPIFTRILSPEDYGYLALATVYATIVSGLAQLGLAQGFDREFFARERHEAAGLLYATLGFVLAALSLAALATWVWRDAIAAGVLRTTDRTTLLLVTFGAVALQAIRTYLLAFFRNRTESGVFASHSMVEAVLSAAFGLGFVVQLRTGIVGIPLGQLIGSAIVILLMLWRAVRLERPSVNVPALKAALRVGLPLTPRTFVAIASQQFDKYLLGILGSIGGVGVYAIAQRFSYAVFTYMTALENAYVPRTMSMMFKDGDAGHGNVGRYLTPFAYASVGVAMLVVLFAEELLRVFVQPEFWGAEPVMVFLALYYTATFFAKQRQLIFTNKTHLLSLLAAAGLGLNVAINLAFIQRWGATGAAAGTCLAGVLTVALTVMVSQRYYRIEYQWTRIAAIFGYLLASSAVILLVQQSPVGYPVRVVIKAALLLGFIVLGRFAGIVNIRKLGEMLRASRTPSVA